MSSSIAGKPTVERIVANPEICGGQPRISGTRIPISVLIRCRELGMSEQRILEGYPSLTAEDLAAAWLHAQSNEVASQS